MNKQIIDKVAQMFPKANIQGKIQEAQQIANQTPQSEMPNKLKELGINENSINQIFNNYGHLPQAKMILSMFGTSPDKLKNDALSLLNSRGSSNMSYTNTAQNTRYPRLKK